MPLLRCGIIFLGISGNKVGYKVIDGIGYAIRRHDCMVDKSRVSSEGVCWRKYGIRFQIRTRDVTRLSRLAAVEGLTTEIDLLALSAPPCPLSIMGDKRNVLL